MSDPMHTCIDCGVTMSERFMSSANGTRWICRAMKACAKRASRSIAVEAEPIEEVAR